MAKKNEYLPDNPEGAPADYVPKYFTINIPMDQNPKASKYVFQQVEGTLPNGRPVKWTGHIKRGVDVHNIPDFIVACMQNDMETHFTPQEKADKSGMEVIRSRRRAYEFTIVDGPYTEKREQ